ncbi:hypothetical protein [Streptomyces sp. NBC_00154]|uniref:hypothetical protein n=1 Tax=Streptomyces sp. NBC_00154 TaxID=2975670 RepID=UPI00338F36F4
MIGSTRPEEAVVEILGSVGQRTDSNLPELDRTSSPWESSMQATCECLSWRGTLDNLERRHEEDRLGESVYVGYPVHARSALTVTHSLISKGILDSQEIKAKMKEVRARLEDI